MQEEQAEEPTAPSAWGSEPAMSDLEALMWRSEASPRLRSTGVIVDVLDRVPEWDRLVAAHEWAVSYVPRLRQKVVDDPLRIGTPAWRLDEDFDLGYHLRRAQAPAPGTLADALEMAQVLAMTPFDRARPLWEAVLVEGLADGTAVYLLKLHHSLLDGQAGVQLFDILHSDRPEPSREKPVRTTPPDEASRGAAALAQRLAGAAVGGVWRGAGVALEIGEDLVRRPEPTIASGLRFVRSLARLTGAPPADPSPLMRRRSISRRFGAVHVPLAWLRAAGKEAGGSVNDAYLAALTGALRRYHEQHGVDVSVLTIAFPVSLRRDDDPLGGNRFAGARIAGPIAETDARQRVRLIRERVLAAREEPALDFMSLLAPVLSRIPAPVVARMTERITSSIDLQASNIPGLARPAYIAGARITHMYPFGPAPGSAVMVTMISHDGMCCIGVNADSAAIPDVDAFTACVREGFDEVLALAGHSLEAAEVAP